jgi:hypothetical protein
VFVTEQQEHIIAYFDATRNDYSLLWGTNQYQARQRGLGVYGIFLASK